MLNIDGLRICPRDAGIILPALEAVERDVGAWIREVRAQCYSPGPLQRDCAAIIAARRPAGGVNITCFGTPNYKDAGSPFFVVFSPRTSRPPRTKASGIDLGATRGVS